MEHKIAGGESPRGRAAAGPVIAHSPAKRKKIAILVAGMHRSGTSAVARTLSLLGCKLPKTLMPAGSANEPGHWESRTIMDLNDEILASAGSAWDDWEVFNPSWYDSPVADEYRERAHEVLKGEFGASRLFVLKDPRICRLLKFWIETVETFGAMPLIVSPIRNPLDVAASLEKRDGIDLSIGQLLWLRHVLDAEAGSRHVKRAFLRYDELLARWQALAERLSEECGVSWPQRSASVDLEIEQFLSPAHRHHGAEDILVLGNPRLSRWIRSSFEILDRFSHGEVRATDADELDRIKAAFDEAGPAFGLPIIVGRQAARRKLVLEAELAAAHEQSKAHSDEARRATEALAEAGQYARHLEAELARRDRGLGEVRLQHNTASAELEAARERANSLKAGLAARDRALAEATRTSNRSKTAHATAVAKIAEFSAYVIKLQQDSAALAHQLRNLEADLVHKKAELEGKSAELNSILCSSSWRLTQPLRSLVGHHPQARRMLRRAAKLAWWTATFQLPKRIAVRFRSPLPPLLPVAPVVVGNSASFNVPELVQGLKGPVSKLVFGNAASIDAQAPTELDQKAAFTESARAELLEFLTSGERLSFPESESPDISVVVVLWNQAHLTLRCLRALLAQIGPSIDVVLVDNGSSDETSSLLSRLDGVRVLTDKTNNGFLLGCNRGAAASRGRSLLLLNNDAFVRPGAIAAALATLDSNPEVGAVGGRLVLTSGRLQEAGSIIWSDASTLGYGRGLPEQAGEAMFRRDVDYCSGAFLLTPRVLWNRLGGVDDAYTPAYYEDADYCMRLREAGYRVVYEPAAVVDHYENGSEARPGDAIGACLRNRKRFRVRHAVELRRQHLPASESNVLAARECFAPGRRRLLVIDNEVPLGSLGSGYPRTREMLREAAAAGWSVTFFPLHQLEVDWEIARIEVPWEIEIASDRAVPGLAKFLDERRGYYDVVIVSRPENMAIVRSTLRDWPDLLDGTRLIYDAEALFSARDVVKASVEGRPLSTAEIEARTSVEVALADDADAIICVNESEANVFRARQHIPVHVLSFPAEQISGTPDLADRKGFLFVGRLLEQETPNWQGLAWFVRECWPLIRASLPDATLSVVGHLHPEHAELEGPGILLLGPVADLEPLYASARVFVAPVRFAAGVPIKILEATAAGLPTAGTRLMARQLRWTPGVEIAAEDDAGALATAAAELHEDATMWKAMRRASRNRLHCEHGATVFRDRLRHLLDGCPPVDNIGADHGMECGGSPQAPIAGNCNARTVEIDSSDVERIARVNAVWGDKNPVWFCEAKQWLWHPLVIERNNKRASGHPDRDAYDHLKIVLAKLGWNLPVVRAASLCCGAGSLERGLMQQGFARSIIGYDVASSAIEQARCIAKAEGMAQLSYEVRDLEREGLSEVDLDIVFAQSGLHHLARLEECFDSVHAALRPGGVFHVHEYVGPDRFQWTDRQLAEINAFLDQLPERYRRLPNGGLKPAVRRPTIQEMLDSDPSEAIRSSEIEPLLRQRFKIIERRELGGTLLHMALSNIAQNFDPDDADDRGWLAALFDREDRLLADGLLRSDFTVITAQRADHWGQKFDGSLPPIGQEDGSGTRR